MNAISEKEFIIDYHQFYPIDDDLEIMTKSCPEVYPFFKEITLLIKILYCYIKEKYFYTLISFNV